MAEYITVPLDSITIDQELQARFAIHEDKVEEYAQRIKDGAHFPPVHCGRLKENQTLYLVDGFHRFEAYQKAGYGQIQAEIAEYDEWRDMYAYGFRANNSHGINYTDEEEGSGIDQIIKLFPEKSVRDLVKLTKVSRYMVDKHIKQLAEIGQLKRPDKIIGTDGKEYSATRPKKQSDYTLCPQCGAPIWPENKGNPDYTYTEKQGVWFCSPECAETFIEERLEDAAEVITGIQTELPDLPSATLPTHDEDEPEPVKHEAEPVLTEDEENEAIAEDLASRLKNFRPQRINSILIIFLFKKLKLTLKNITNITTARRSKNDELPEEEKTGFKWKLNDGSEWELPKSDMDDLRPLYPAIDFEQELRKSIGWSLTNPKNRKTKSGILKHINSWLTNAQNKAARSDGHAGRKSGYVSRDAGLDFENLEY